MGNNYLGIDCKERTNWQTLGIATLWDRGTINQNCDC